MDGEQYQLAAERQRQGRGRGEGEVGNGGGRWKLEGIKCRARNDVLGHTQIN